MDKLEKYGFWLEIAEYDLETASAMLESGRLLYVVFMCQQAIEKLVKGLYLCYLDDNIPRIHAISQLLRKFEKHLKEPVGGERYALFDRLTAFYIEGRYTTYKNKLYQNLTLKDAKSVLIQTREAFAWLLTLRP